MTNSSQGVTASLTLSAFGQTVASTGSSTSTYGFGATSGYRTEGDAGLTLVGCRFYDTQVGRFITRDTVLTEKPYAYCNGDPVNHVDPDGHRNKTVRGPILNIGYGVSLSLDIIRWSLSGGIAIGRGGVFGYTIGGVYNGIGAGASCGPTIGLGYGSMNGFSGFSGGGTSVFGEHGGGGYSFNNGYSGGSFDPPILSRGSEYGLFPIGGSSTKIY